MMYHAVLPDVATSDDRKRLLAQDQLLSEPGASRYALDRQVFERQMMFLGRAGVKTPARWDELTDANAAPGICLTFDDGHRSNYELVLPILLKCHLSGMFFITTDWIGQRDFMSKGQLRELRKAGMLVGSHGGSHTFFSSMTADAARRELAASKRRLEAILKEPVTAISLPGGRSHPQMREMAREAGYQQLFTSSVALAHPLGDPLDWPRLPITNNLSESFVQRLMSADPRAVRHLSCAAALRQIARAILGKA